MCTQVPRAAAGVAQACRFRDCLAQHKTSGDIQRDTSGASEGGRGGCRGLLHGCRWLALLHGCRQDEPFYTAGYSGMNAIENSRLANRIRLWMARNGTVTIFVLVLVPPFLIWQGFSRVLDMYHSTNLSE
jgi:hypothetical protein